MNSPSDYDRPIAKTVFDKEIGLATVTFACTEEEEYGMIAGNAITLRAWITFAEDGEYDLQVTSDDSRLDRRDVRSRIVESFNARYGRRYSVDDSRFDIDANCFTLRN